MELNKRQKMILQKVNSEGAVKVSDLSKKLFFSEMTIRRDLALMEKEGLLRRVHGGALANDSDFQYPVNYRENINKDQKKTLADHATKYLKDHQVLFFNSSSTLAFIVPYLSKYKDLHIITNSVYLLSHFEKLHIPCVLTGGAYNEIEKCLCGRETEAFLKGINPDVAFLSCEALSNDGRVTDSDADLAEIALLDESYTSERIKSYGGISKDFGTYKNETYGEHFRLTFSENKHNYILLLKKDGSVTVFNQKSYEGTAELYESLSAKLPTAP